MAPTLSNAMPRAIRVATPGRSGTGRGCCASALTFATAAGAISGAFIGLTVCMVFSLHCAHERVFCESVRTELGADAAISQDDHPRAHRHQVAQVRR